MDFDDPFSEPVAPKAPTTNRFQPKAKARPKKGPLVKDTKKASVTSAPQNLIVDESVQLHPNDNLVKISDVPLSSSMVVTERLEQTLEDKKISVQTREVAHSVGSESMEVGSFGTMRKDLGVDNSSELQSSSDIICPSTTKDDRPAGSNPLIMDIDDPFSDPAESKAPTTSRFQPKAKPRPKKGPLPKIKDTKEANDNSEKIVDVPLSSSIEVTQSLEHDLEDGNLSVQTKESYRLANSENMEVAFSDTLTKDLGLDDSSEFKSPSDIIRPSIITDDSPTETSMPDSSNVENEEEIRDLTLKPCNSEIAPNESIDKTLQDSECFKESLVSGYGDFQIDVEELEAGDFSCLDILDVTKKRAVKYQPKPKALTAKQRDSNTSVDGNFSSNPSISECDTIVSEDTESLSPENEQSEENLKGKESSDGFEGNEYGNETQIGTNVEFHDNSSLNDRVPNESPSSRDENNNGDNLVEEPLKKKQSRKSKKATSENDGDNLVEESSQKKRQRKSKKAATEKDKPTRKRKKDAEKPDEAIVKAPKKFPRGTRRKRCVDKSLLEAPEDELDLQRVPIRDLIIFAEYKERQAKKQAASTATLPPATNESTENTLREDPLYDENGSLGFDEDGEAIDNPSTSETIIKDTGYFNYQTYMTKEPRAKWTMHDTELFYKGISQFGSDLSMIQQLFPGRTRHQIKLKYKKEERQNPMRLNDALANRAQDLSHFELVITRLQEQAAQEAKSDKEDSDSPENKDEETEVYTNNEDVANSEQDRQGSVAEQEPHKNPLESPSKSYYSEDDEIDWSAYKSEL